MHGFDASTRAFVYDVNPRFGAEDPRSTGIWNPLRISASVLLEMGKPKRHSDFERFLAMAPLQQDFRPAPADSLANRLAGDIMDAYSLILRQRDSLLLTTTQLRSLDSLHAIYTRRAVDAWRPVAAYINRYRDRTDFDEVDRRIDQVTKDSWALERKELPSILAVLSPAQGELARSLLRVLIQSERIPPPRLRQF